MGLLLQLLSAVLIGDTYHLVALHHDTCLEHQVVNYLLASHIEYITFHN